MISKIKTWLDDQEAGLLPAKVNNIELLKKNLEYSEMRLESSGNGEQIIIIQIAEKFKQEKITDKNIIPNLVLILNGSGDIKKGYVTLFKPSSDSYKQVPNNTFNEIFNKTKKINCSGEFQFLSITGHREYQMEYKNGNLFSFGTMKIKQTATGIAKTTDCSEWWLITTIYYGDGTTEVIEQYLGTTCDDCGSSYPATCDDNGGGGGGGGENGGENCCVPQGFNYLLNLFLKI